MNRHPFWDHEKLIEVVEMSREEFIEAMAPLTALGVDLGRLVTLGKSQVFFFVKELYVAHEGPPPTDWTMAEVVADNYRPDWFVPISLQEIMAAATCFGLIPNENYLVNW